MKLGVTDTPTGAAADRMWPAALAAVSGSTMVGFMPLVARQLYAAGLGAPSMLFWRYTIAITALSIVAAAARLDLRRAWRGGAWRIVFVGATLGSAQTLCFWQSLKTLDTSIAMLLFDTYPALTLVFERLLFKNAIRPRAAFCIAIILLGAGLITVPSFGGGTLDPRGLLWALPSPAIYALYLATTSRLLRGHPPVLGALGLFAGMALTFGIVALFIGLDMPGDAKGWLLLLFIGVGSGALTMTLFSYSVARLGASGFAILANAELVTVVLIGTLVLGEAVTPNRAVGGGLIVAGILAHALSRRPRERPLAASPAPTAVAAIAEEAGRSRAATGG